MPEPILAFSRVSKRFADGTVALAGVDLRVAAGEFVAIVGPSGCGKSTLLRIASGLAKCTGGRSTVAAKQLGYVFQDATLLPWRTVQGNVELLGELNGISKEDRTKQADDAIALVGLNGFESKYPKQLSGGMRMRVSLARALTMKPE